MNPWDLLLWAAALCAAGAVAAAGLDRWKSQPWAERATRGLQTAAAALAALAFVRLLSAFITKDVTLQYVFLYTHVDLPIQWRIAGTWAGREGSLLLWASDLAIVAALVAWRHSRRAPLDDAEATGRAWTRLFLGVAVAAFLLAAAAQKTFAPTPSFFLQGRPGGNGLNPTLKSAFILIHPPIMFAAYSLATVPAAAVLGHLASGTDRWSRIGTTWSRVDWLLYTFAMGLGGLWAYYTLGFGGYWAWDPVEVANLLPWLALTVFLHAQLHHARHGSFRMAGPFLGLLPFLLTLFSTISTRSGLWVSVHAFTDPTNTFEPDAPARFLDILHVEAGLLVYVRLFLATIGLGLALWCLRLARESGKLARAAPVMAGILAAFGALGAIEPRLALALLFELAHKATGGHVGLGLLAITFLACIAAASPGLMADPGPARRLRIDLRTLAGYSVIVLGLSLTVLFLAHMAAVNGWDTKYYEKRLPWLVTPGVLGLLVLQGHSIIGRKRSLWLAGGVWAAAGVAAVVASAHREGAYLLVLGAALVAVSLDRVRRAAFAPGMDKRAQLGPTLVFAASLLDLWFWLDPPATVGFGPAVWHPVWPAQLFLGAAAVVALFGSILQLAGVKSARPGHIYLLAGLLGGFWVAPILALAGWLAARRSPGPARPLDASAAARLRQVGLYGAHLGVAIALLAYAPSTYWKETATADLGLGEHTVVGPSDIALAGVAITPDGAFAASIHPAFTVDRGRSSGHLVADLVWEPQVGAHFPHPATLRGWTGDTYVNVVAVHIAGSDCSAPRTIQAYQAANPPRACAGDAIDRVTVQATWLPGVGLMWTALAVTVLSMALMLASDRPAKLAPSAPAVVVEPTV